MHPRRLVVESHFPDRGAGACCGGKEERPFFEGLLDGSSSLCLALVLEIGVVDGEGEVDVEVDVEVKVHVARQYAAYGGAGVAGTGGRDAAVGVAIVNER